MMNQSWKNINLIALDIETTGPFPIKNEICEIAAVKYSKNGIVDIFHTLVKIDSIIEKEIIDIHGITNKMLINAPQLKDVIKTLHSFVQDGVLIAHNAPFDIGFIVNDFEKYKLPLLNSPILCSSLLSRKIFTESPNHKLQTLIKFLNLDIGTPHRAKDDALACLQIALKMFNRLDPSITIQEILKIQDKQIRWENFSIKKFISLKQNNLILSAINNNQTINIKYKRGLYKNQYRPILPLGIVRNPDGDYIPATCFIENKQKRFYLSKIIDIQK